MSSSNRVINDDTDTDTDTQAAVDDISGDVLQHLKKTLSGDLDCPRANLTQSGSDASSGASNSGAAGSFSSLDGAGTGDNIEKVVHRFRSQLNEINKKCISYCTTITITTIYI